MLTKKIAIIGTTLAFLSLPLAAYADLTTTNNTNEDSTVKVTSNSTKPCAATFGEFTPAHTPDPGRPTKWGSVKLLCAQFSGTCTADIYMTKTCDSEVVATAALDLSKQEITITSVKSSKYEFLPSGSHLTINYKK